MAAWLLIIGSVVFGVGAAIGVPAVFTTPDPARKRELLEQHLTRWRIAQPFYATGPILVAIGTAALAATLPPGRAVALCVSAAIAFTLGSGAWAYACLQRATDPPAFAAGTLPAWPFTTYVVLTISALALLSATLLISTYPPWLGWLTLTATAAYAATYVLTHDIPPFLFYLLTLLIGLSTPGS
jgi:hypothetical protein